MRFVVALQVVAAISFVCGSRHVASQDPPGAEKSANDDADFVLPWNAPFSAISGPNAKHTVVCILITNDDRFSRGDKGNKSPLWCERILQSSINSTLKLRPELKKLLILQKLGCGTPPVLTGGEDRNRPSRAVLIACDTEYKLLALRVGVPDKDGFREFLEDARFIDIVLQSNKNDKNNNASVHDAVAKYVSNKMPRVWRTTLANTLEIESGQAEETSVQLTDERKVQRLIRIGETFEPVYLDDARLRFGLSQQTDRLRLAILEQHTEARLPWCNTMIPFVVGQDIRNVWRSLVEIVWKTSPVTNMEETDSELMQWWDEQIQDRCIVLGLEPPALLRMQKWPPVRVGAEANKRSVSWIDLHDLAVSKAFRVVNAQTLANLLRERGQAAVDVTSPSRARYVVFEPRKKMPFVIRESDVPAKQLGRLKRLN